MTNRQLVHVTLGQKGSSMKKILVGIAAVAALSACLFGLAGCGGNSADTTDIQGQWEVLSESGEQTGVTVVYTDTQFKTSAATFEYTLDTGNKTITYTMDKSTGSASYEFSDDRKTLTLTEDNDGTAKTTTLSKISDDTSAEPGVTTSSSE